jgi:predicted membrane protein
MLSNADLHSLYDKAILGSHYHMSALVQQLQFACTYYSVPHAARTLYDIQVFILSLHMISTKLGVIQGVGYTTASS